MDIAIVICQVVLLAAFAPLVSGVIAKVKNDLRMRRGPGVFQPYHNLAKFFSKQEVVSEHASWIFRRAPLIVLASSGTALALMPMVVQNASGTWAGDLLAMLFVLALGRFFLALAGLDTGSAFGGMGSSREMFIAGVAEPVACLAIFSLFMQFGTTSPAQMGSLNVLHFSTLFSVMAIFMVTLAETTRIPIDNQETHLELTMVHEAMVLEYSGRSLALVELAAHVKQMVWFLLIGHLIYPTLAAAGSGASAIALAALLTMAKVFALGIIVAVLEISVAKMRLFRVTDFFAFGFVLAVLALICAVLGV
ncbi:MAG: NADH-quinone oxidoreductase subunit H [Candidatus Omnitrophota bacterium]|nr:NADH-quinone oxidoreductase subunit H [Candidatus Omnitrophota bacterium]MDZ4243244.1 NADH-quinone oxidoreductase subunit H [Candidatus Omnitrophota bacterium]